MLFSVLSVSSVLKLLGFACEPEPHPHDSRNDQVRALRLRASVRADGALLAAATHDSGCVAGLARSGGLAIVAADFMDHRCDGRSAVRRNDDEPHHRSALRPRNPRTRARALRPERFSVGFAWAFALAASAVLVIAAWQLNTLAFELPPLRSRVLFFYSYTKRFTRVTRGAWILPRMSPAAAWIAIAGSLDARMLILCAARDALVGGFDVLYACQDIEYDKSAGLFSVPKRLARPKVCQPITPANVTRGC